MKTLSPEILKEITIETRQCFLNEDAPSYLANLEKGLAKLQSGQPDYILLMHAAHSLKGGSAIAELISLSKLAHKLEDMLEILQHHEFCDRTIIAEVLSLGIDEVASVLSQASNLPNNSLVDLSVDLDLLQRLDDLLAIVKLPEEKPVKETEQTSEHSYYPKNQPKNQLQNQNQPESKSNISPIVISALEKNLETCIQQLELQLTTTFLNLSESKIKEELQYFCDECLMLGDTLKLDWLICIVEPFESSLQQTEISKLLPNVQVVIDDLRSQRNQYLYAESLTAENPQILTPAIRKEVSKENSIHNSQLNAQMKAKISVIANPAVEILPEAEAISYLRIPSAQVESMTNTVAEMILRHERLLRQQQQLGQTNKNLQALVLQMIPLQEQVQTIYDQLVIDNPDNNVSDNQTNLDTDFDQLELDQYSSSHITLQNFQEVLLRIRESRSDIDLSYRDIGEEIEYLRQDLDRLYGQLTQSRLVPFKTLAGRFVPQLKRLCQKYNKQVELIIQGEEILIDQAVLEQLQTPLNHLLVNAFDHGIETPETRLTLGKSETATIYLSAVIAGNQVIISLKDDGDGINLDNVYARAVEKSICPAEIPINKIPRQEIINFIFQPNFSTRNIVSDISGRGMGLDIVRSQINRLRGNIQVDTAQGQGTNFTLRLPIGLSLVNLLICTSGENLIAIAANDVLDIFPYTEAKAFNHDTSHNNVSEISWRKQIIPLLDLNQSLAYAKKIDRIMPKVCLVLNRNDSPIAIAIGAIIEERQLIIKPFDSTVKVPSYLTGCTILGTGQVVPVLVPDNLQILLRENIAKQNKNTLKKSNSKSNQTTDLNQGQNQDRNTNQNTVKTILIAEDSIATRNMLEQILKQLDFEVIACRDGQEALDMLIRTQGKITMVISDVEMPRLNGFNLLQTIRSEENWTKIPV
ncbi:MAG: ATP-binding protein, partial [Pseudanabaena sp.]